MDIKSTLDILSNPIVTGVLGAAGTAGLATVFNYYASRTDIDRYTAAIESDARKYATLKGMAYDKIVKAPLDVEQLSSITIATTKTLMMTGKDKALKEVPLTTDIGVARLTLAHGLLDQPDALYAMLGQTIDPDITLPRGLRKEIRNDNKNWTHVTLPSKLFDLIPRGKDKDAAAPKNREDRVTQALMNTAKVLAKSSEPFAVLSDRCHLAIKWTDAQGGAHIAVMPAQNSESGVIRRLYDQMGRTPDMAKALLEKLAATHAKRTQSLRATL